MTPKLDYVPRLVDANRQYRVTPAPPLTLRSRYWPPGAIVTDQGKEGACVGHGIVNEAMASPVRVKFDGMGADQHEDQEIANGVALGTYNRAKQIDEWEGIDYEGTSVRAGMLVGRERGFWTGFRWAFNLTELRTALEDGPVVIGVEWREQMYDTKADGTVVVGGPAVGGHCLLITGYSPNWNRRGPHYRWRNSWGLTYGVRGTAYITPANLDSILFRSGGEAAVPIGRAL